LGVLIFFFAKQKPPHFRTVVIAGALKKVLCVLQFADRSERLRQIVRTRDFAVQKGYRSFRAASTTPFGSSHLLFCKTKTTALSYGGHRWRVEEGTLRSPICRPLRAVASNCSYSRLRSPKRLSRLSGCFDDSLR